MPSHFRGVALLIGVLTLMAMPMALGQREHHPKKIVREQIEDLEQQWRAATLADDTAAMDKLLSDDYLGITVNGDLVTKSQQMDRMRTRSLDIKTLDLVDVKVKVVGQVAIVTSLAQVRGTSDGRPINGSFRYTRVYQYVGAGKAKKPMPGSWRITSFEVTRVPKGVRAEGDPSGQ